MAGNRAQIVVLLAAGWLVGCDRLLSRDTQDTAPPPPPPPAAKAPAPVAKWAVEHGVKLTFEGAGFERSKCDVTLYVIKEQTELRFACAELPHPVEVTFDGVTRQSGSSKYDTFAFPGDFTKRMGAASLDAFKDKLNPKVSMPLEVTFTFSKREPLKVSPPAVWTSADVFKTWAGRPVRLGETDRPDDGKKSAILIHEGYSGHDLVGEGTVLDDLDFIAVQRDRESPAVSCFGGRLVYRTEADVTLYDRRTGATVDTKHFKNSNAGCPSSTVVGPRTEYQSAIYPKAVTPWLATRIRK